MADDNHKWLRLWRAVTYIVMTIMAASLARRGIYILYKVCVV